MLQTIVTLIGSDDYRFVVVGDFGIVSSYQPRTVVGDVQTSVYVSISTYMYMYAGTGGCDWS